MKWQVNLNTRISLDTMERLDDYAVKSGRSKASIVDEALQLYLRAQTRKGTPGADNDRE